MRDHTKLRVFELAGRLACRLVMSIYQRTRVFPESERYGLRSQIRRAAVSIVANIVEGCARTTQAEYVRFLEIAYGSSRELGYEIGLCKRLGYLRWEDAEQLGNECTSIAKSLSALLRALRTRK